MMLASSLHASWMTSAAFCTSCRVRSGPPTTLMTTPSAPRMRLPEASSRRVGLPSMRGQDTAAIAASTARSDPVAVPMPTRHVPASFMIAQTSAKSTFIKPARTTISEVPTIACRSTLSHTRKASSTAVLDGTSSSRRSLLTSTTASAASRSLASEDSKFRRRVGPSKRNGLVTTAIVRAPASMASSATTGAAPEPVPPPSPAVTKTMSAPSTSSLMSFRDSSAALAPTDGLPPAPSPRVSSAPSCRVWSARDLASACASVLRA
mmetsp:Transcript_3526/g.13917  ORF Transcript_3526/g.13917 Transcript_3526/m.13917 type:complete len:264 (-) Transcript_3526:347-1138(-)